MIRMLVRASAVLMLLAPAYALATDTVQMTSPAVFSVNSIELDVANTAQMSSTTVTATSLIVTVSANSNVTVTAPNRNTMAITIDDDRTARTGAECNSPASSARLLPGSGASATFTITPSATLCVDATAAATTGGGSNGPVVSSGGGGAVFSAPVTPSAASAATTNASSATSEAQARLTALQAQLAALTGGNATGARFTALAAVSLTPGKVNTSVKTLQQMLNSDPDTRIAATRPGSPGKETTMFGSLTQAAVKKFQAKYNIVSSGTPSTTGYGTVGPKTRAKLNQLFGQ